MLFKTSLNTIIEAYHTKFDPKEMNHFVTLSNLYFHSGNVSLAELVIIAQLTALHKPTIVLEIGTFIGRTTINIAANMPLGSVLHTVDIPWVGDASLKVCQDPKNHMDEVGYIGQDKPCIKNDRIYNHRIQQTWLDSAKILDDEKLSSLFYDMIFIDGSHSYEYAKQDSITASKLIKDNGIIIWHDYKGWPGVTKALHQMDETEEFYKDRIFHIEDTSLAISFRNTEIDYLIRDIDNANN